MEGVVIVDDIVIIDTGTDVPAKNNSDIYDTRAGFYEYSLPAGTPEVSIFVLGYNKAEKTKACVESILKYTQDIAYELILVDSGSSDNTLEYYKAVQCKNKKILALTKNINAGYAIKQVLNSYSGNILVQVNNDIVVTQNWLSNMLICLKSDKKIGMVNALSTNVSNYQQPPASFTFTSTEELQRKAAHFNVSDPTKWQERIRLITLGSVFRREALDLSGTSDYAFLHEFSENDWCLRIRRAGYKLMLCGDTVIHHNHDFNNIADKDPRAFYRSIALGRADFIEKHLGLDAFTDALNFELGLLSLLDTPSVKAPTVLGVDTRMGTPILELCNKLRQYNITSVQRCAYTTKAKYYADLQSICGDNVICDRIEYIKEHYNAQSFDYIIMSDALCNNTAAFNTLAAMLCLLKRSGRLLIKLACQSEAEAAACLDEIKRAIDGKALVGDAQLNINSDDNSKTLELLIKLI